MTDKIHTLNEEKISKLLLVKSGFWYTVSNFLTRAMVFITMPFFTRLMSKEEYGDFGVFATWQSLLLTACGIEVYATLNRARFDFHKGKELDGYVTSALVLSSAVTALVFALYMAFPDLFDRFFLLDRRYMLLMFAYLFTCPALNMFQAEQRIAYKYRLNAAISFFLILASSVAAVLLALYMEEDRLLGRIIGQYGLTIVAGICFYVYYILRSHSVTVKAWKYALRIGVPMIFSYIGSQILLASDSLVVKQMCSGEQVSYLSVTHTTSHIILILVQTLNTAWAPWFFDMMKNRSSGEIKKTYRIYLWGVIACTFTVLLIGPEIILVLGGTKYNASAYILPPIILCGIFTTLTAQFGNLETYYKKPEYAAVLTGVVAVLNILLNVLGVKLWGYQAVCYTTVFCQIILIGFHYIVTQRMGIRQILSLKTVVLSILTSCAMIPFALLLYQSNAIRYGFVLVICLAGTAIAVIKRKEIIQLLHKFKKTENS